MTIKAHFNPSTGKVAYNPVTGKVQVRELPPCEGLDVDTIEVTWADFLDCGCTEERYELLGPFSGVRNV